MICVFEILHFLPLLLIVVTAVALKFNFHAKLVSASILALSVVGLIAGQHMHSGVHMHHEPFTLFDPCVGYIVSLIGSSIALVRSLLRAEKV